MHYVYILLSLKDGKLYTGYSSDLKRRYQEHIDGNVTSTCYRRPLKLIYYEAYLHETDAKQRERHLKAGGKAKLNLRTQIKNSIKHVTLT